MSDPLWDYAKSLGAENAKINQPVKLFTFLCRQHGLYNRVSDDRLLKKVMKLLRREYLESGKMDRSMIMGCMFDFFDHKLKWDLDHIAFCRSRKFYQSSKWKNLRLMLLERQNKCAACGRSPKIDGIVLHVDHILPRSTHPEYALNRDNLQVLCADCNIGKGNTRTTKF